MAEHHETHVEIAHDSHAPSDTVTLPIIGRTVTVQGGIYTVVFGVLAALTLFELIIAELPDGFLTLPILLLASLIKAVLVVMFYMHLNKDNPMYRFVLAIPVAIALTAALWLMAVPPVAY